MVSETGPLRRLAPTTNGGEIEPGLRSLRGSLGDRESDLFDEDPVLENPLLRMSCTDSNFKFVRHSNSVVTEYRVRDLADFKGGYAGAAGQNIQ